MPSREMPGKSRKKLFWFVHLLGLYAWGVDAPLLAQADTTEKQSNFGLVASLDFRRTNLQDRLTIINGAVGGIRFGQRGHMLLLGYHWLGYDAPTRLINWRGWLPHSLNPTAITTTDARFVSLSYWYPIVRTNHWFISLPVELGYGGETTRYIGSIAPEPGVTRFQLAQAGVFCNYRLVSWLGVSARGGYRQVLDDPAFSQRFSGLYYSYGLGFYLVPAYYSFRDWRRKRLKKKSSH